MTEEERNREAVFLVSEIVKLYELGDEGYLLREVQRVKSSRTRGDECEVLFLFHKLREEMAADVPLFVSEDQGPPTGGLSRP